MDDIENDASTSSLLSLLSRIEAAADDVLLDRAQIVELDKKRQENRMAQRQLKSLLTPEKPQNAKTWICLGNTFIKFPTTTAHSFLESSKLT